MYKESLKKLILEHRTRLKIPKSDLAVLLGVSYPTYLGLDKSGNYSIDQIEKMCKLFELDMWIVPRNTITNL